MNEQQIRDMKPEELDAAVAEHVMGWEYVEAFDFYSFDPNDRGKEDWNPSIDLHAAMEVEAKVLSMDDETKILYMQALWDVLNITVGEEDHWVNILKMVHASAADRCRAALLAIGGAEQ